MKPFPSQRNSELATTEAQSKKKSEIPLANVNDQLIHDVFDELAKAKPSVMRLLLLDDDEDEPDLREMADLIIRNYPWVIGVELRRLFSGSLRSLNEDRLQQLCNCLFRSVQFLSVINVIELYEVVVSNNLKINGNLKDKLSSTLLHHTFADLVDLLKPIGQFLDGKADRFIPKLSETWMSRSMLH